jgi:hypothetical protein
MKRMRKWLFCPLIVAALLLCAIPAYADIPTLPHAFYGTLTILGSPAPVGTVVTAEVNSVQCGSITTTVAGQYGGSGAFDPKLTVSGDIETGATISFKVNGNATGSSYDYPFSPGVVTEHNLVVTVPDNDPPVMTINPLSPDPTNDNTPTFTGTAVDALSTIASVEYEVGAGSWRAWTAATPVDGAFDSLSEEYTFTIPALADGGYTVYVRATDSIGNTNTEASYASDSFTVDTTAPTITSRDPASGATGVSINKTVTATFSEAMDASTITAASFTLVGASVVSGSISYNAGTNTASFDPATDLEQNTEYTATLTMAITDAAGNPLASASSWSFTTGTSTVIPGDANEDGVVNALDITKVERIIAGLDAETQGADANEDGEVNALDITMVEIIIVNS